MKAELERVDFGGELPKYNHQFGSALFPGRSSVSSSQQKNGFSLFDFNPHKGALGLNLQEYTAEKLCPRPSLADLHSDSLPTTAAKRAAGADAGAAAGAGTLLPHQQQLAGAAAADTDVDAGTGGRRKKQRLMQQQQQQHTPPAAAAGAAQPSCSDTLASVSADGTPNGRHHSTADKAAEFVFIGSSSESGSESDDASGSEPEEKAPSGRPGLRSGSGQPDCSKAGSNSSRGRQPPDDQQLLVIISSDSSSEEENEKEAERNEGQTGRRAAAAAAPAAAAGGDGGSARGKKQQRGQQTKQQQEQQQEQDEEEPESDDMSISSSDDDEGDDSEGDGDDDNTVTMTEGGSEEQDEEFIPLLTIQPGVDGSVAAADAAAGGSSSGLQEKQQQRAAGYQPPWLPRLAHFSSPLMRLHNEIVAFCQMLAPTAEEVASRAASLDSLREVVRGIWPAADVRVFGSYETGLYTPASDTDVVVVDSGHVSAERGLTALASALEARHLVRNMQLVLKARVPIIKFEMIDSGLAFDVSWEVPSGPQGAQVVKQLLEQWPALKPLALVLKVFLTQRELNEVYTGGVGSYTLIIMIVAFLQLHQSRHPSQNEQQQQQEGGHKRRRNSSSNGNSGRPEAEPLEGNLGVLLLDFLRLYGRVLNLNRVGITSNSHGAFFDRFKKGPGFMHSNRGKGGVLIPGRVTLAVEDPIDSTNDTARGSFNMRLVRQVFDHAYQLLNSSCPSNMSLLGRIIHLAPVISGRPVPPWCVEATRQGSSRRRDRSRSRSRSLSRSPRRHKHRRHDSRSRDRGRDKGRHDKKHSSSRGRDRSRGEKQRKGRRSSSGGGRHHGKHSSGGGGGGGSKQHRRSSGGGGGGQQQGKRDKGRGGGQQQEGGGGVRGGVSRGHGSRQSLDSEREYRHRSKRQRQH